MKRENIFDAFEYADPAMVHMAEHRTFPRHTWQKGLTAAAVLMLLVGAGLWAIHRQSAPAPVTPPVAEEPIQVPETPNTETDASITADEAAFAQQKGAFAITRYDDNMHALRTLPMAAKLTWLRNLVVSFEWTLVEAPEGALTGRSVVASNQAGLCTFTVWESMPNVLQYQQGDTTRFWKGEPLEERPSPWQQICLEYDTTDFYETTFSYPAMDARHASERFVLELFSAYLQGLPEEHPFAAETYEPDKWEIVTQSPNGQAATFSFDFNIVPRNPEQLVRHWPVQGMPEKRPWTITLYGIVQKQADGLWSGACGLLSEKPVALPTELPLLPGILTQEQVDQVNEAFQLAFLDENNTLSGVNPLCYFLTSYYDSPKNLNLPAFLNYFTGTAVEDEAEFQAVRQTEHFREVFGENIQSLDDFYLPVHRISKKSVDDILTTYAGITTEDLNDTENLLYLKAYNSYYNFTSDFGLDAFCCTGGTIEGNLVRLDGMNSVLVLEQVDGRYLIRSHRAADDETDTAIKTPEQMLLESQLEAFDMMYRYTGESLTFEPSGWDLTITLPEEWKDEAVLLCTHPNYGEYHTIKITSNTLMKAYQEQTGRREDCSWYDYVVQFIGIPAERTWGIEMYQEMTSTGWVYDAGICSGYHYFILLNRAQGTGPDEQVEPIRDELKEAMGEDAYRALIDALKCDPERAQAMIRFDP